jgi:hypothetical protein
MPGIHAVGAPVDAGLGFIWRKEVEKNGGPDERHAQKSKDGHGQAGRCGSALQGMVDRTSVFMSILFCHTSVSCFDVGPEGALICCARPCPGFAVSLIHPHIRVRL